MSSRIELKLAPSLLVGMVALLPWLLLITFLVITALAGKTAMLIAAPVALAGATLQYRGNGLLLGRRSVNGLLIEHNKMFATMGGGRQVQVFPLASSRIWSGLALLKLRPTDTSFCSYTTLLLAHRPGRPGNVSEDDFRRLKVWLRLGRPSDI